MIPINEHLSPMALLKRWKRKEKKVGGEREGRGKRGRETEKGEGEGF